MVDVSRARCEAAAAEHTRTTAMLTHTGADLAQLGACVGRQLRALESGVLAEDVPSDGEGAGWAEGPDVEDAEVVDAD